MCLAGAFRSSIKIKRHLYNFRFNIKELCTELTECLYVLLVMFEINSGYFSFSVSLFFTAEAHSVFCVVGN
jgi:hypothetical protein